MYALFVLIRKVILKLRLRIISKDYNYEVIVFLWKDRKGFVKVMLMEKAPWGAICLSLLVISLG